MKDEIEKEKLHTSGIGAGHSRETPLKKQGSTAYTKRIATRWGGGANREGQQAGGINANRNHQHPHTNQAGLKSQKKRKQI